MAFFNEFPHARTYDDDLGWLIANMKKVIAKVDNYNEVSFADPIAWNISTQYPEATIVRDGIDGPLYISRKPVPVGITLNNGEYWEVLGGFDQMFSGVIKNVQDYGAAGIAGADYTEQVQAAIDDGNIIYFPAGEYSFKGINISKPMIIFGDGETTILKPLHRIETSNQYATMFIVGANTNVTFYGINFTGNNTIADDEQTGEQYYQTSVIQAYRANLTIDNCFINDMIDTYHLSVGALAFPERNGIFLYASQCSEVNILRTVFHEYGGEELIWISRPRTMFASGNVTIDSNIFENRSNAFQSALVDGSAINVLGSRISYSNNYINNCYARGSHVNLLGDITSVTNNIYENSNINSCVDCCEGYYSKSTLVSVLNNTIKNCNAAIAVEMFSADCVVKNNIIEAITPVKFLNSNDYSQYDTYHNSANLESTLNAIIVKGNSFKQSGASSNYFNSGLSVGQSAQAAGSRSAYKLFDISDNTFINDASTSFGSVVFVCPADTIIIDNNYISAPSSGSYPTSGRKSYMSYTDAASSMADKKIRITNNIYDNSIAHSNCLHGNCQNANIIASGNTGDNATNIYITPSSMSDLHLGNNYNINY